MDDRELTPRLLPRVACTLISTDPVPLGRMHALLSILHADNYDGGMGVTVQVRDLDDDVQQLLKAASEREGMSLSAFLRRELTQLAARLEAQELAHPGRSRNRLGLFPDLYRNIGTEEIVRMIREDRDR